MDNAPFPSLTLTLDALSCRRGDRLLFSTLSLAVQSGDMIEIKGPNGVGKSSLLRILSGLLPAESGTITLQEGEEASPSLNEYAHYLGHQNSLKSAFSVADNLGFWRDFSYAPGLTPQDALNRLELSHLIHLPCGVLSAGQRRRVAFARLLVAKRPIWLLDEPTAALDSAADALVGALISDHVKAGGIVMAATHLPLMLDIPASSHHVLELSDYLPKHAFVGDAL
ncbi:MAG: heme ABC exporter ATP-binding protein CcmA [Hyphomicrobiales bacterium]